MDIPTLGLNANKQKSEGYERNIYSYNHKQITNIQDYYLYNRSIIVIKIFNFFKIQFFLLKHYTNDQKTTDFNK